MQKADASNDSFLSQHDVAFEELASKGTTMDEMRAYILLRQSQLSPADRKRIVIELRENLKCTRVCSAIRLLGSHFFGDLQGSKSGQKSKVYDANTAEEEEIEKNAPIFAAQSEDFEGDLDAIYMEAMLASEDSDTLLVAGFEEELESFLQDIPELQDSKKALRGWRREVPLPKLIMYGIAMRLYLQGFRLMALKVITDFDLYLRPGEGMDLRGHNVVSAVSRAGPQYRWYTIVVRDQEDGTPEQQHPRQQPRDPLDRTCPACTSKGTQQQGRPLVSLHHLDEFRKEFVAAGEALGIPKLHPYQLRHDEASEDLNSKLRDHNAVKARGRWKTDQSVRRYGKVGKIQELLNKLTASHLSFCRSAQVHLKRVFQGHAAPLSL